jgi:hypothetical protein
MEDVVSRGTQVLIPPDALKRKGARPGWDGGAYAFIRRVLETETGGGLYRKRAPLSAEDQRKGRALPSHHARRLGLRASTAHRQSEEPRLPAGSTSTIAADHTAPSATSRRTTWSVPTAEPPPRSVLQ